MGSVDFVIHFAHAYAMMPGEHSRAERSKHALIHMGPSILAAAFTTLAAATVMLFTVITFFQKFALILFLTIIFATVGTFVVFLALTDCVGPKNPTYLFDKLMNQWRGESSEVSDEDMKQTNHTTTNDYSTHGSVVVEA